MAITAIMCVLDEAERIAAACARLTDAGFAELIVVDGGSRDDTAARARAAGATVIDSPRGRGRQLNAGARAARGDTLLFVHADVQLPPGAAGAIAHTLADPAVVAGAFRTWTVDDTRRPRWWAPLLHLADVRSRYSAVPYGDQAMFVRADVFFAAGGFPDIALMEDIALSRRLHRFGRVVTVDQSVRVSGRRFVAAPLRQTFWVNVFPLLFAAGVSPRRLARLYGNPR